MLRQVNGEGKVSFTSLQLVRCSNQRLGRAISADILLLVYVRRRLLRAWSCLREAWSRLRRAWSCLRQCSMESMTARVCLRLKVRVLIAEVIEMVRVRPVEPQQG